MRHVFPIKLLSLLLFFGCNEKDNESDRRSNGKSEIASEKDPNVAATTISKDELATEIDRLNVILAKLEKTPLISTGAVLIASSNNPIPVPELGFTINSFQVFEYKTAALSGG